MKTEKEVGRALSKIESDCWARYDEGNDVSSIYAAAPELLAALETVIRRIDANEVDRDFRTTLQELLDEVRGEK
jgi:hypothetical protein